MLEEMLEKHLKFIKVKNAKMKNLMQLRIADNRSRRIKTQVKRVKNGTMVSLNNMEKAVNTAV